MELPQEYSGTIRCSQCQHFLSLFPIHSYANGASVCARCPLIEDDKPTRDHAYEKLAKNIYFPCMNVLNNCLEKLQPEELKTHEAICPRSTIYCPSTPKCEWYGSRAELIEHYSTKHAKQYFESLKDAQGKIDRDDALEENYLLEEGETIFIIQIKFIDPYFYTCVKYVGRDEDVKRYFYVMHIIHDNNEDQIAQQDVLKYDDHIVLNCDTAFSADVTEIGVCADTFKFKILITDTKPPVIEDEAEDEEPASIDAKHILAELECRICFITMVPPIYQCTNGHVICDICKPKYPNCPTCQVSMAPNIRNLPMESLANRIDYSCPHEGCRATYKPTDKNQHESICTKKPYKCPINGCDTQVVYTELHAHFNRAHEEELQDYNRVNAYENAAAQLLVAFRGNKTYVIRHKFEAQMFHVAVVLFGPREDQAEHMYTITIDAENEKLYFKLKMDRYKDGGEVRYMKIPIDILQPFKNQFHLIYSLDMFENK